MQLASPSLRAEVGRCRSAHSPAVSLAGLFWLRHDIWQRAQLKSRSLRAAGLGPSPGGRARLFGLRFGGNGRDGGMMVVGASKGQCASEGR